MDVSSLLSFILIIIAFAVLPSLLKLLGKYTAGTRDEESRDETEPEVPGQNLPQYPGNDPLSRQDRRAADHTMISNEPIRPKWF